MIHWRLFCVTSIFGTLTNCFATVSAQSTTDGANSNQTPGTAVTKINCEVLYDDLGFELRWVLDGDDIIMQLVGRVDPGEFMALGLGKNDNISAMLNADAMVTWIDSASGKGFAVDYHLGDKTPCTKDTPIATRGTSTGVRGSCPDVVHSGATDSVTLLHSSIVNGFSMVTFKRPQLGVDPIYDQHIYSDGAQSVIWSIGPVSDAKQIMYHRLHSQGDLNTIDFARTPSWNCPPPDNDATTTTTPSPDILATRTSTLAPPLIIVNRTPSNSILFTPNDHHRQGGVPRAEANTASASTTQPLAAADNQRQPSQDVNIVRTPNKKTDAWEIPNIICPKERLFRAQIGPTGGSKGYQAITGKPGWGIAWYINGLLAPELVVERGTTYTFLVEGGNDPITSSRRHPFYITNDAEGGYDYRTDDERAQQVIYAGAKLLNEKGDEVTDWTPSSRIVPTAKGRLCEWQPSGASANPDQYSDFFTFQRTLNLQCLPGQPGVIRWTPDNGTPDNLYYQCWTHRNLGWKIRVVDNCDHLTAASTLTNGRQSNQQRPPSNLRSTNGRQSNQVSNKLTAEPKPSLMTVTGTRNSNQSPKPKKKKSANNSNNQSNGRQQTLVKKNLAPTLSPTPPMESITNNRDRPVQYQFQPHLDAWMYQPPSWTFEASIPMGSSDGSSGLSASDASDMTLEPFFVPSYPLPPISSERTPIFIRQRLPDPIPIPRDKNTGLMASGMRMAPKQQQHAPMMPSGFVPMKLKSDRNLAPNPIVSVHSNNNHWNANSASITSDAEDKMSELKLNISRYGFPFLDTSVRKKKLAKIKNLAPEPYISPSTMSASVSSPNSKSEHEKMTPNVAGHAPESYLNIRIQNLHHYPGNSVTYKVDQTMATTPASLATDANKLTTAKQTSKWTTLSPSVAKVTTTTPHASVHSALRNQASVSASDANRSRDKLKKRRKLPGSQRIGNVSDSSSSTASRTSSIATGGGTPSHSTRSVPSNVEFSSLIFDADSNKENNRYHHYNVERKPTNDRTPASTVAPTLASRYRKKESRYKLVPNDSSSSSRTTLSPSSSASSSQRPKNEDRNVMIKLIIPEEKSTPLYYSGASSASPTSSTSSPSSHSASSSTTLSAESITETTLNSFSFPAFSSSSRTPKNSSKEEHSLSISFSSTPSHSRNANSRLSSSSSFSSFPTTPADWWNRNDSSTSINSVDAADNNLANHRITSTLNLDTPTSSSFASNHASSHSSSATPSFDHSFTLTTPALSPVWTPASTTVETTTPASYLYYSHEDADSRTTTLTTRTSAENLDANPKLTPNKRRVQFDDQYLPIYSSSDLLRLTKSQRERLFDPETLQGNRTDHTILNHILSLIAVGETPPEVKIFTKPIASSPSIYSTHVEIHKELRARSRRSLEGVSIEESLRRHKKNKVASKR